MTRSELLKAASQRLEHAVLLLTAAGEERLATDVEELVSRVDFTTACAFKDTPFEHTDSRHGATQSSRVRAPFRKQRLGRLRRIP